MAIISRGLIHPSRMPGRGHALVAAAGFVLLLTAVVSCVFATPYQQTTQTGSPGERVDVIFITDVPETEVYVKGGKVGTTDEKGQLLVKLLPGNYNADARKKGYFTEFRSFKVGNRTPPIKFFMRVRPAETPTPTPPPTPTATPTPTPAPSPTPKPAETKPVLERYLDPKLSDQVKLDDWHLLLASTYQELSVSQNDAAKLAQLDFVRGQVELIGGNFANALEDFKSALRRAPGYALAWHGTGSVYLATKQWQRAADAFESAAKLNPQMWLAYRDLGAALNALKKKKEAAAAYARATELGYTAQGAGLAALTSLVRENHCEEAMPTLKALSEREPSADVFVLLGDCYRNQDQRSNARQMYTNALGLDPNLVQAFAGLGEVELRDGNIDKAMKALENARDLPDRGKPINRQQVLKLIDEAQRKQRK
jgi:tetratricopeptide (TPR) repeat protein